MIIFDIILFVLSCFLLYRGADHLIDNSRVLVNKFAISPVVVGATVVALGTSLPELIVSTIFSFNGQSLRVYGNIVGSNIANISLALGLVYVMSQLKIEYQSIKRDILFLISTTLLFVMLIFNNLLDMRFGFLLLFLFAIYLSMIVIDTRREKIEARLVDKVEEGYLFYLFLGIFLLSSGSFMFDYSSNQIAVYFNVSDMLLGVTLIAIGTSAPEIVTSMVSLRKNENEFVVGNIIGSNLMNILIVLGVSSIISTIDISDINYNAIYAHSILLLGSSIFLYSQLRMNSTSNRIDGFLLIGLYFIFLFFTYNYN